MARGVRHHGELGGLFLRSVTRRKKGSGGLDLGAPRSLSMLLGSRRRHLRLLDQLLRGKQLRLPPLTGRWLLPSSSRGH